jgi:hypothetical protein
MEATSSDPPCFHRAGARSVGVTVIEAGLCGRVEADGVPIDDGNPAETLTARYDYVVPFSGGAFGTLPSTNACRARPGPWTAPACRCQHYVETAQPNGT